LRLFRKIKRRTLLETIRSGIQTSSSKKYAPSKNQRPNELLESKENTIPSNQSISIADEIIKLAKLREEEIITEEEFKQMKQDLIRKNSS
jgi:hypothetical protein